MERAVLALQGGGTRGAFTSGVLDVFLEKGIVFSSVYGTSAGALNAVNYLSGDIGRSKFVICELTSDPKFLSLHNLIWKKSIFDFGYLFSSVPKTVLPFSQEAFDGSPIDLTVVATGLEDGKAHYFHKRNCAEFMKAVEASASLPLLSKPVEVEGHLYLDGGPADSIPFRVPYASGEKKIVVVSTREKGYQKKPMSPAKIRLSRQLYRDYPLFLRCYEDSPQTYNSDVDLLDALEREGRIFLIRPEFPTGVSSTDKNKKKLAALYEEGRRIALARIGDMRKYLGGEQ